MNWREHDARLRQRASLPAWFTKKATQGWRAEPRTTPGGQPWYSPLAISDDLLLRAADVVLKKRRRLLLLVRETPLHLSHLRLLVRVAKIGAVVMPPMPAFYHRPATLQDVVNQTANRAPADTGWADL